MQTRALAGTGEVILECVDAITGLDDALSIISATYELSTHRVLLRDGQLPAEFFELRTRFAGDFIQKLVNYQLAVACVFDENKPYSERFREYVGEARRGRQFRSFTEEREAVAWLEQQ